MAGRAEIDKDTVLRAAIKRAKPPAMLRVAEGLYLQLGETGAQSWLFRFQIRGRRRAMGLGSYPEKTLADARAKAAAARKLVDDGIDPIEHRQAEEAAEAARKVQEAARAVTFDTAAAEFIKAHRAGWGNARHAQQWENTLKEYASPVIGALALAEIETAHVLQILTPIWTSKTVTADRVRNRIELILDAGRAQGRRSGDNPARWRGHLDKVLPKKTKIKKATHHPALPWQEMPDFWSKLCASTHRGAPALRFIVLTACRRGEAAEAQWSEIDLEAKVWTIPASRTKTGTAHRVPLSDAALEILQAQLALAASKKTGRASPWVFPGQSANKPVSGGTLRTTLCDDLAREDLTIHGFRSTFRDWSAEETHYPRDVCEMALAHKIESDVESAYRRGDLLEKRRTLMADWASYVTTKPAANVVQLSDARASA